VDDLGVDPESAEKQVM